MNLFMFTKDRYVFATLPFWLLLSAIAVWELMKQTRGLEKFLALGLLVILMTDAAGTTIQYYLVNHGSRLDWRAAFQIIKENSQPEDIVVAWWPEFSPFYLGREILSTEAVSPNSVLEGGQRHWFVIDSETVWGNIPLNNFLVENAELIDILYLRLPEDNFNIKIYLYDPSVNTLTP